MIIRIEGEEPGFHVHVRGNGNDIKCALCALFESLLEKGMPEWYLIDIVADAMAMAHENECTVYTDTDSIKHKLPNDGSDRCMELVDEILNILKSKRRRDDG